MKLRQVLYRALQKVLKGQEETTYHYEAKTININYNNCPCCQKLRNGIHQKQENNRVLNEVSDSDGAVVTDYWNSRFATEENYEWCKSYSSFQNLFHQYVPKTDNILIVGNGNSNLPIDLYNDSYVSITSLDYAENSIKKLQQKSPPEINYVCADMRYMKFGDQKFDTAIEKGTLDVLFTKEPSPWSISEETAQDLRGTLSSIKGCLNDNGKFISVTFAEPFFRKKHYSNYWSDITVEKFGDMFHYYFIVCRS